MDTQQQQPQQAPPSPPTGTAEHNREANRFADGASYGVSTVNGESRLQGEMPLPSQPPENTHDVKTNEDKISTAQARESVIAPEPSVMLDPGAQSDG